MKSSSFPELSFPPDDVEVPIISLQGPFISEIYAVRNFLEYRSYVCQLSKCNITVARDVIVLTDDLGFSARDNLRLELGLNHHLHNIEVRWGQDSFAVVALDSFLLMNPEDIKNIREYLESYPFSVSELKSVTK